MFIKKRLIHTSIVFIGILLLIIGYTIIVVTNTDQNAVLPLIAFETVLFISVISYLDLKKFKKALERDKFKKINEFQRNFFTNITHEFRTPLTLISVPIQEKLENKSLSEKERTDFTMMQRNTDRLLNLVNQLLDISKVESGMHKLYVQKGEIFKTIDVLAESLRYQIDQKQITYLVDIEYTNQFYWFDADIIEKIVTNLLSNAYKYTPKNGNISLKAIVENNILCLEIKNSGKGLSEEECEKIFERFYQVDENQPGSGIGLTLVKELVELHKGTITVKSDQKKWTIFMVQISLDKKKFKDSDIILQSSENKLDVTSRFKNFEKPVSAQSKKTEDFDNSLPILLIVEDNEDLRTMLSETFRSEYKVIAAENGQEGLDLALKHIPDLIISDAMMPIKDGITLTRDLKQNELTSHIPVILLTAKVGEDNELSGIKTGADDYITKPFNNRILIEKVKNILLLQQKIRDRYAQEPLFNLVDLRTNDLDEKFLIKVKDIFEEKLTESSFTIEDFSNSVGMSRMQLHRKLKTLTGLSASEFIRSQRLKLAAHLLKKSDANISEIGYSVGFNNISYFTKCFKEMYHCTPTEYSKK